MEISFVCILFSHSSREELGWSVEAKQHHQYITSRSYLVHNFQTITICSFKLSRPSRFLLFTFENRKYVKKERPTLCTYLPQNNHMSRMVGGRKGTEQTETQSVHSDRAGGRLQDNCIYNTPFLYTTQAVVFFLSLLFTIQSQTQ